MHGPWYSPLQYKCIYIYNNNGDIIEKTIEYTQYGKTRKMICHKYQSFLNSKKWWD